MRCLGMVCPVLGALAGCNQVFGLEPTIAVDADVVFPDAPDGDHDNVADLVDNCSEVPNPLQSDVDHDGRGDVCDNCPIIANPQQHDIGDLDGIGDACDPNPKVAIDCLLVFDSFADPAAFKTTWQVAPAAYTSSVTAVAGAVTIAPPAGFVRVGMFSLELTARAMAAQALATKPDLDGEAGVATDAAEDLQTGFLCWIGIDMYQVLSLFAGVGGGTDASTALSTDPVDPELVLRLVVPFTTQLSTPLQCRADFGVAVAATRAAGAAFLPDKVSGPFASGKPLIVHAIALYGRNMPNPCPPAIIH